MAVDQVTLNILHSEQTTNALVIVSSAAPVINSDYTSYVDITALAVAANFANVNLTGTPQDGQTLTIRVLDNGSARAITWGTVFEPVGAALISTTVPTKRHTLSFRYSTLSSKWGQTGAVVEA